ncbi:MAG: class I SAM-dependent rRNA methyltransferase [Oscillospiraceae bacterium]|nr:class I SAM-dependent rRNA methyltransferase [Oscillospiraceae bacterium]
MAGQVCLRRGEELDVRAGSLWIYDNEIDWADDSCQDGDVVEVLDSRMKFLAWGFFNAKSKITVRILSRDRNEIIDAAFLRRRLQAAWDYRRALGFGNACRVVFGESDGLPGLTVDKFGDYLSVQILSLGMDRHKDGIVSALVDIIEPKGICERDDVPVREKEGLPQTTGVLYGEIPPEVEILEHDARMLVDIRNGQKTGHFLDQQENRGRIKPYCPGWTVLDLCSHTGGFAIHAALYGAASVEAVDLSESALEMLRRNAALNGVEDKITTVAANVFDYMKACDEAGRRFETVICDPPAFAKSRKALEAAYRGYKELNLRCMRVTAPGGFLITCSCSQFMTPELFLQMLRDAAADSGRTVRLLETLIQSRDHPAALNAEQSLYLKGYILQVV